MGPERIHDLGGETGPPSIWKGLPHWNQKPYQLELFKGNPQEVRCALLSCVTIPQRWKKSPKRANVVGFALKVANLIESNRRNTLLDGHSLPNEFVGHRWPKHVQHGLPKKLKSRHSGSGAPLNPRKDHE